MAITLPFVCVVIAFLLQLAMLSSVVSFSPPDINTDKHALLALKAKITHDPNNLLSNSWSVNTSVCNWIGVTCATRHRRVKALNISYMGLAGTIPRQLGNLSFLSVLDITKNNFYGSLPDELAHLNRLKYLSCSSNNFNPNILSFIINNMSSLEVFNCSINSLSGSFPTIRIISRSLQVIDLGFNKLSGELPSHIFNYLPNLKVLYLDDNMFKGQIPSTLSNCKQLQQLAFSTNNFTGVIPKEIGNLTKLKQLYLGYNELQGSIPEQIGNLMELEVLDLRDNNLDGTIPNQIGKLTKLEVLHLNKNNLRGSISEQIGNLIELEVLDLRFNTLNGTIPNQIGKLTKLEVLRLNKNNLQGIIPKQIGNLTSLEKLEIAYNNLQGDIPSELGNLRNLKSFGIDDNNLTGSIPHTLFNISSLEILSLSDNRLSGNIHFSNLNLELPNLEWLFLARNSLSGMIPSFITNNASKLSNIELGGNQFTGSIPNTIGNLRDLQRLYVIDNYLSSSTPELNFISSLTNCKNLKELVLDYNPLNGSIPSSIGNLSASMTMLTMRGCTIGGTIPPEFGSLKNLMLLDLESNELSGPIPNTFRLLLELQGLFLGENKLQGLIPRELCRMEKLSELHLQDNKLFGSIPTCLGDLISLRKLLLSSNRLNSNIPSTLWNLSDILELNLSANYIGGPLPLEVGNLKASIAIDLSRNHLFGSIPTTMVGLNNLKKLSLAQNRLQGPIPRSIGDMIALEFLDLSNNNLSGDIPKSMETLKSLIALNLSFNKLEGRIPTKGAFMKFSSKSFMGNLALCGSPKQGVPHCKSISHKNSKMTYILLSTILPLAVVILTLVLILIRCMRKGKKFPQDAEMPRLATWRRFSYHDLLQATDGFSDSNLLGSGSFGSVYGGRIQDGTKIAIKVFHPQFEGAFKSFDVECQVMSNVRHRNLVKVISSCSNDDYKAVVMEYMSNGNLDKWLYSHNYYLDTLQRLDIMIDVASALEYLHFDSSTQIIHCDLKPSNILLDEDMVAHVSDFGIAKILGDGESMRHTQILATIGYMAPEYGREGKVSRKCDVYSYGTMLMETFTRKKPTDESFTAEMSLKRWVSDSLHNSVMKVVDTNLLSIDDEHIEAKEECLLSILSLAMECTHELPTRRVDMRKVVSKLVKIRATLLAQVERRWRRQR